MKLASRYYVKPDQMNHHDSLYGGRMTDWMMEAAFFGIIEVVGRKDHIVMCAVNNFRFIQEVPLGTIIEVYWKLVKTGRTSLTIALEARDMLEPDKIYSSCEVVFVNLDENGKSTPHGIVMEE